jgi:uncharacterized RDD family membrane protein YckC
VCSTHSSASLTKELTATSNGQTSPSEKDFGSRRWRRRPSALPTAFAIIDHTLQLVLVAAAVAVSLDIGSGAAGITAAALVSFALTFGYDVLFETLAAGRTSGKRLAGLRVVTALGGPVTFHVSAIRNLLRAIDFLPGAYVVGAAVILIGRRNQRLGDVAAGTLVIRVPRGAGIPGLCLRRTRMPPAVISAR